MRKIYRKLTKSQRERGVVFSSTLSKSTIEQQDDIVHEIEANNPDKRIMIQNLLNDNFFNESPWKYNIIRR